MREEVPIYWRGLCPCCTGFLVESLTFGEEQAPGVVRMQITIQASHDQAALMEGNRLFDVLEVECGDTAHLLRETPSGRANLCHHHRRDVDRDGISRAGGLGSEFRWQDRRSTRTAAPELGRAPGSAARQGQLRDHGLRSRVAPRNGEGAPSRVDSHHHHSRRRGA